MTSDISQKAKTIVVLVVCFSRQPELRWLPLHCIDNIGEPPFQEPYGSIQKYVKEYNNNGNNMYMYIYYR
jgi:hypothetical protein